MPLFDYKCSTCNEIQEQLVLGSEVKEVKCSKCGGRAQQQLPLPNSIFSGGGWARDGYEKKS